MIQCDNDDEMINSYYANTSFTEGLQNAKNSPITGKLNNIYNIKVASCSP